eukprot:16446004-Heterocapsa_arctica.AAC.1
MRSAQVLQGLRERAVVRSLVVQFYSLNARIFAKFEARTYKIILDCPDSSPSCYGPAGGPGTYSHFGSVSLVMKGWPPYAARSMKDWGAQCRLVLLRYLGLLERPKGGWLRSS